MSLPYQCDPEDHVLTELVDHVLVVTINRPERMNSIGGTVITDLSRIFLEAEHDNNVRVILFTGAGRAFCSGLDLKDVSSGKTNTGSMGPTKINETPPMVMRRMDTPIVCALNGAAAGYGMDMALGCDMGRIFQIRQRLPDAHSRMQSIPSRASDKLEFLFRIQIHVFAANHRPLS